MKRDRYLTKYTCALLLLVAGLPCMQTREECYKWSSYTYYCEDGYECCLSNSQCCKVRTHSSSSWVVVAGVFGGVFAVFVLLTVLFCICKRMNRNKTVIQPQVIATVDHQQQPQQQPAYYTAYPSGSYPSAPMTDPPMYTPAPDHVAAPANLPEYSK